MRFDPDFKRDMAKILFWSIALVVIGFAVFINAYMIIMEFNR
jgi:hypothetical protein